MRDGSIGYGFLETRLGLLLVAASERGVCQLRFGETREELVGALRSEFPFAALRADAERLAPWIDALRRHLDGGSPELELPLDVRGSRFQRRVWDALRAIPYGETRSYGEVAAAIGRPTAARAVARACATNPVGIVIPCHRVVARGGAIGGYRYGVERKRALLDREAEVAREGASQAPRRRPAAA